MQITRDDIFVKVRVSSAASKVHEPKHTPNTAMHYSYLQLQARKLGFEGDLLARVKESARVWIGV